MPKMQRFLISDFIRYALTGIIEEFTRGCEVKLRKDVIDLSGKQFADLQVLRMKELRRPNQRGIYWICKCICNKEVTVYGGHLRSGSRKSCGCRAEKYIHRTGINRLYSTYKAMAKRRNHEFVLDWSHFANLVTGNCYYCGIPPSQKLKRLKTNKLQIKYNGIDRVDPQKGYTPENAVSCCYYCNHGKADLTIDEFKEHVERMYRWQKLKGS